MVTSLELRQLLNICLELYDNSTADEKREMALALVAACSTISAIALEHKKKAEGEICNQST